MFVESDGNKVNLNDKISGLTQSLTDISEQIKEIYDKLNNVTVSEDEVKKIINDYISGATNEIKVAKNDDNSRLIIGFADDAIFG